MGKNMISERGGKNMILYEPVIYRTPAVHVQEFHLFRILLKLSYLTVAPSSRM